MNDNDKNNKSTRHLDWCLEDWLVLLMPNTVPNIQSTDGITSGPVIPEGDS